MCVVMSLIGIKFKGDSKIKYFEEREFSKDNKEKYLHKIIETEPKLILEDLSEGKIILLGSKITMPSRKEADLICCDASGEIYIIELKRGKSPRKAIAQLLDYASSMSMLTTKEFFKLIRKKLDEIVNEFALDETENFKKNLQNSIKNPNLLLVSYEIPDDIKRMAKFLRSKNILINCVEFDYYKDKNNNEIFVPKIIGFEETIEVKNKTLSSIQKYYFNFFSEVIETFKKKKPGIMNRRPTKGPYMQLSVGHKDCHLEWIIRGKDPQKKLSVGLHLESKNKDINYFILNKLKNKKEELAKQVEGELKFEKWGKNWAKIEVTYPLTFSMIKLKEKVKDKEKVINWGIKTMITFYEFFKESGILDEVFSEINKD